MLSYKAILSIVSLVSLSAGVSAAPPGYWMPPSFGRPSNYGQPQNQCGKTNVFFTGLPANHPLVTGQGFDASFVAAALAEDKAAILAAGYNIKTVLRGPEQPESVMVDQLHSQQGVRWDVTAIGFGVRGAGGPYLNLTIQFEDEVALFRKELPFAPIVFNRSPNTTLEALRRKAPIEGDCSQTPGTDYGTKVYCDICP